MHLEYDKKREEYKIRFRERQIDGTVKNRAIRNNFKTKKQALDYWKHMQEHDQMSIFDILSVKHF